MVKNNKQNKKRISPNTTALISAIVITLGGFFLLYNFVSEKKLLAHDYMNSLIYNQENETYDVNTKVENIEQEENTDEEKRPIQVENYIGYLEIPKIKFKRGFYDTSSSLNDVEANIEVIKGSSMPDVLNGNLIIAGHSGTGWKAFFKDLYKLELNDEATVTYNGSNYIYKIVNIYKEKNTGTIGIRRNYNKNTLTLVTCTKDDSSTQTIYILELTNVIE